MAIRNGDRAIERTIERSIRIADASSDASSYRVATAVILAAACLIRRIAIAIALARAHDGGTDARARLRQSPPLCRADRDTFVERERRSDLPEK